MSKTKISEIDSKIDATVKLLRGLDCVHSILLFGSISKKRSGNDIDICYIPSRGMNLKERLAINSAVPEGIDISMYFDLPVHIRKKYQKKEKCFTQKKCMVSLLFLKKTILSIVVIKNIENITIMLLRKCLKKEFSNRWYKDGY